MQTLTVSLNTAGTRVIRAKYGSTEVFGASVASDPIVAEAVRGWEALGRPDNAKVEVIVATAAEINPAVPEPDGFDFSAHKTKDALAQAFAAAYGVDLDQSKARPQMEADAKAFLESRAA